MRNDRYLMIFDDSRRALADKVRAACDTYTARFGTPATLVLVQTGEAAESVALPGVTVLPGEARGLVVQPHMFYVGRA